MDLCLNFNCNGRVNCNDWKLSNKSLFLRGEIDNVLYPQDECSLSCEDVNLFGSTVPASIAILNLRHFTKCMDMQLKILSTYEKHNPTIKPPADDDLDFYCIRKAVCEFILYVRLYLNSIKWNIHSLQDINEDIEEDLNALFISIKQFLGELKSLPDSTFYYAPSNLGNKSKQPEFHMYHMHIELRWLLITLVYTRNIYYQHIGENQLDDFENVQETIVNDLVYISLKIFEMTSLMELQQKTPYNCTCNRELWLMLQIFIDSLSDRIKSKTFWDYVNDCLNKLLKRNVADNSKDTLPFCMNPELFSLWLLYHLSLLYGYTIDGIYLGSSSSRIRPNYEQIEKILRTYISKGGKDGERDQIDKELNTMIALLNDLITNWWQPRVSVISLLWDCFHKRLEEPFLLQTTGPWTLSVERKTAADILKQVRERICDAGCNKESSYGMFLRLLGSFFKKYYSNNDTKHWNQMKGRIYSKFSKSKVQEFSVNGIYNFISLFLTLAIAADSTNVCSVMLDLLPPIKEYNAETSKKYNLIWKGKLTVLLLYNDLRLNFSNIASTFVDTVSTISCCKDDTSRTMMTNFVDVFGIILSSSKNVDSGEHLFVGGWIDRYLLECPSKMSGSLIKVLLAIFKKCIALNNNSDGVEKMLDALWCYVACRVRQLAFDPILTNEHYQDISKLAVEFTLEALRNPAMAKKHKHSAMSLFQHFASSMVIKDIRLIQHYLVLIITQEEAMQNLKREVKNFDNILIQAWFKCSIIGYDSEKTETKILRDYIMQLNDINQIFLTSRDVLEFQDSEESVLVFMMCAMKKRKSLRTEQERIQYDTKWRLYLNHIEKWILTSVTEETKDSKSSLWIYRCIGTLILCTSPMLYTKNQPNNLLKTLITKTVLSTEYSFIRNLGKKIFSMVLLGIESLSVKSDISLQVLIRDLFDTYIPLLITAINGSNNFKASDSLLKCFRDAEPEFLKLILEMLMSNFFTISSDKTMHKHSYLIMVLLQNVLDGEKSYSRDVIESIITICTPHVMGCYMKIHEHHPHKQQTVSFVKSIVANPYYTENSIIRDIFKNVVCNIVQKSLGASQQSTFDLMRAVSSIKIDVIDSLSPEIESILKDLERYRRPNAVSLRYSWNQLQNFMRNMRGKP